MPTMLYGANPNNGKVIIAHSVDTQVTAGNAAYQNDGWGCQNAGFGNLIMATAEINEAIFPSRHLSNDMTTDTCGPGKWRGQCGSLWIKEATTPQSLYTFVMSMKYPAAGVNGGGKATPDHLVIEHADGSSQEITHTALYLPLGEGSKIVYQRGGGGGWSDALESDPEKVSEDVLDEYVRVEAAERAYGVVFRGSAGGHTAKVNEAETKTG